MKRKAKKAAFLLHKNAKKGKEEKSK